MGDASRMEIRMRKKTVETAEGEIQSSKGIYEWSANGSGKWYPINRSRMTFLGDEGLERYRLMNNLFDALLSGLTCRTRAKYSRNMGILEVEL